MIDRAAVEAVQQQLFAEEFERRPGMIVQLHVQDVGMLVVEERTDELHLRRSLLERAADTRRRLSLHVLTANLRAAALYERAGLRAVNADEIRVLMRTQC